jgi:uncharacterized protein YwgA
MNRLQKAAVVSLLIDSLRDRGSWTGETHVQKATYLLQHAAAVPLDYEFVLYKHGPFSFDLRDDLNDFNGDGMLAFEPQPYPYGPKLQVTKIGARNIELRSQTAERYSKAIKRVVDFLGSRGVNDLERLATAFMLHEQNPNASEENLAQRLVDLKPHVGHMEALMAVREIRKALPSLAVDAA